MVLHRTGGETVILCHKDSGVLVAGEESMSGLFYCGCISGWVRGFEPIVTREEAIEIQRKELESRLAHYRWQGRSETEIARLMPKVEL